MNKLAITSTCIAMLFVASEVAAQGGMGAPGERGQRPDFSTLDTDANGFLSAEELGAMMNNRNTNENAQGFNAENMMSRMDTNSDSMLSEEEFSARPNRGQGGPGQREQAE